VLSLRRRRFSVPVCPPTTPEVVARCVRLPLAEVMDLAAGVRVPLTAGTFTVDGAFVTSTPSGIRSDEAASWRAPGHIGSPHRPRTSVTLELTWWSDDVTELRLRSARLRRWGERRRRRYFDRTHDAADGLLRHLVTTSAVLWRPPARDARCAAHDHSSLIAPPGLPT